MEGFMELEELLQSIDIVEYISQYVDLELRGDEWWGLSCFKDEKTPSFSVRQDPPVFYDYSSGIGGNLYTFVRYFNRCSGPEAIEILKQYAGFDGEVAEPRKKMSALSVCKRFQPQKTTQKSFTGRILPDDYMLRYERPPEKLTVWENEGISAESLDKFQVFYDGFSDRLVYPIRDPSGKIINVGGRTLDPLWKEKKLKKYCYFFQFGTINTIYGLSDNIESIKKRREIILFEGCKSVLLADTWGIHNTGAILTSHLSQNQAKLLIGLGCSVVFALDNDVDIRKDRNIQKLSHYVNVEYIYDAEDLLSEKDSPVDRGKEVFERLYASRRKYNC